MKILRITVNGLPLFKQELDLLFYTQQRVSEDDKEKLYKIEPNYYLHTACAFIGINASGKTSVLKVINLSIMLSRGIFLAVARMRRLKFAFLITSVIFVVWKLLLNLKKLKQGDMCIL